MLPVNSRAVPRLRGEHELRVLPLPVSPAGGGRDAEEPRAHSSADTLGRSFGLGGRRGTGRRDLIAILCVIAGMVLTGCAGGGDKDAQPNSGGSINVAIVDTPSVKDLALLTPS
ncbi:MAG TPA: hypothetical protein VGN22_16420, partial [Pseudonocardia sp.]